MARQGTRVEEKRLASAQYRAAMAQSARGRKRLANCQLRAPITGFVGMRRIDAGDTVAAGAPVISVLDLNPVKVRVAIPEAEIGKVREGARATVSLPSLDGTAVRRQGGDGRRGCRRGLAHVYGKDCGPDPEAAAAGGDGERDADFRLGDGRRDHRARERDRARSARRGRGVRLLNPRGSGFMRGGSR